MFGASERETTIVRYLDVTRHRRSRSRGERCHRHSHSHRPASGRRSHPAPAAAPSPPEQLEAAAAAQLDALTARIARLATDVESVKARLKADRELLDSASTDRRNPSPRCETISHRSIGSSTTPSHYPRSAKLPSRTRSDRANGQNFARPDLRHQHFQIRRHALDGAERGVLPPATKSPSRPRAEYRAFIISTRERVFGRDEAQGRIGRRAAPEVDKRERLRYSPATRGTRWAELSGAIRA